MSDLIDAHLRHLRAAGLAEATTIDDRSRLLWRLERDLPMGLERATVEELEDFLATPSFSRWTKCTYYMHIVGFFRWATDPTRVHLDYDPSAGLRRPKAPHGVPKPVTNAQLAHALANLPEPWLTYIKLAAYEGARAGEVATIDRADIDQQRTRIHGKGDKTRVLKTHCAVWQSVEHFPAGRLARRIRDGGDTSPDYISSRTILVLKRIDLPGISLHAFRHWYGTMMLRPKEFGGAGASLRTVQENMGHASPAVTARYTLVSDEERDDAIASLPTFDAPSPS